MTGGVIACIWERLVRLATHPHGRVLATRGYRTAVRSAVVWSPAQAIAACRRGGSDIKSKEITGCGLFTDMVHRLSHRQGARARAWLHAQAKLTANAWSGSRSVKTCRTSAHGQDRGPCARLYRSRIGPGVHRQWLHGQRCTRAPRPPPRPDP